MRDSHIEFDALVSHAHRERAWLPRDYRGRWVVLEAGAGHHLTGQPKEVRQIVDLATPRRARRFSSLSRARAFARSVDGTVHRWRRISPTGSAWKHESPWQRATMGTESAALLASVIRDAA